MRLDEVEERGQAHGSSRSGASLPSWPIHLRERGAAEPARAAGDVDQHEARVARVEAQERRQRVAHVAYRRERRDDERDRRGDGALVPPSVHVVRIDIESLPTGIDTPRRTQVSSATARTVSYSAASSPG